MLEMYLSDSCICFTYLINLSIFNSHLQDVTSIPRCVCQPSMALTRKANSCSEWQRQALILSETKYLRLKHTSLKCKPPCLTCIGTPDSGISISPYLVLEIRRDHLIEDSLEQIALNFRVHTFFCYTRTHHSF